MTEHERFGAWSSSANALWRMRERLRALGTTPESDDDYVTAWVTHADRFSPPPPYPGTDSTKEAVPA